MAKILFNADRCTGCRACEGACKQEHNLPVGVRRRIVTSQLTGEFPTLKKKYKSSACKHCVKPKCLDACPFGAISKTEEGLVIINQEQCTGCKECVAACPFNEMKFNDISQKACKCNYCQERTENGLLPACVNTCMTMALAWEK